MKTLNEVFKKIAEEKEKHPGITGFNIFRIEGGYRLELANVNWGEKIEAKHLVINEFGVKVRIFQHAKVEG